MGKIKRFLGFFLILVLSLTGCSVTQSEITSGRDMKLLLDDQGIDCASFDVSDDLVANAEILTCLDGSVKNEPFSFLIWRSMEDRDLGFADFCLDLKRRGNAEGDLIVQDTWVAYSSSSFFSADDLAEELGAEIISGESFCSERGLEIALTLTESGIVTCNAIHDLFEDFKDVSIDEAVLLTAQTVGSRGFYSGDMGNVDKETLSRMSNDLRLELRKLITDPDVPQEVRDAASQVEYNAAYKAATKHENGTAPLYFFVDIPEWARNTSLTNKAAAQQFLDEVNSQYIEHNLWVADFKVELAFFNLSVAGVLDACSFYAPFDW